MSKIKTKDLADKIDSLYDFDLDLAVFILKNIADERNPLEFRMRHAMDLMPYLYAKKKDISVDARVGGDLTIRWMTEKDQK